MRLAPLAFVLLLGLTACNPRQLLREAEAALISPEAVPLLRPDAPFDPAAAASLQSRAEATGFRETSRYADVVAFLNGIAGAPSMELSAFGETVEGRALPLLKWNVRPGSDAVRVLVVANIHAGEVAGKEAALHLLRDLALGEHPEAWRGALELVVVPIYNADGNERIALDNRPYQNGPHGGMGQRPNAQGLDLNRDFTKLASPEARALVRLMAEYDPHVVLDLHTTNGTFHAYALTYAPPLAVDTPASIAELARGRWLPAVTAELAAGGRLVEYYGNFKPEWGLPPGWATFSPQPRFGTNYAGLRGRFGLLSEAYAYDSFEERVRSTEAFTRAVLDWAASNPQAVLQAVDQADAQSVVGETLTLRADYAPPTRGTIVLGEVELAPHPDSLGLEYARRIPGQRDTTAAVYGRFAATLAAPAPAGYLVPRGAVSVVALLDGHGIHWRPAGTPDLRQGAVRAFIVNAVERAERTFQGVHQCRLEGQWTDAGAVAAPGYVWVPVAQPLGRLAFALLEPQADDGVANWALLDAAPGTTWPILRVEAP